MKTQWHSTIRVVCASLLASSAALAQAPAPAPAARPARPAAASAPRPAPAATNVNTATKAELVARLVQLQQGLAVSIARALVEQPVMQLQQQAASVIQQRFPAEAREAAMKDVQAESRKYVEEVSPIMRDSLQRLAAATMAPIFEEKFNEDELRQLITVLESPVLRKYEQTVPDFQRALQEKLVADVRGRFQDRLRALDQAVSRRLQAGPGPAASAPGGAPSGAPTKP